MAVARTSVGNSSEAIAPKPEKKPVPKKATNGPRTSSQNGVRAMP